MIAAPWVRVLAVAGSITASACGGIRRVDPGTLPPPIHTPQAISVARLPAAEAERRLDAALARAQVFQMDPRAMAYEEVPHGSGRDSLDIYWARSFERAEVLDHAVRLHLHRPRSEPGAPEFPAFEHAVTDLPPRLERCGPLCIRFPPLFEKNHAALMLKYAERDGAAAREVIDVLANLRSAPLEDPALVARFEAAAAQYRGRQRPELPQDARRFKVQAELAVEERRFSDAAELFKQALTVAPWWPEGHYNRALVLGELGSHALAIRSMKRYLALVPDAPDAQAAQDRIYAWEAMAERRSPR